MNARENSRANSPTTPGRVGGEWSCCCCCTISSAPGNARAILIIAYYGGDERSGRAEASRSTSLPTIKRPGRAPGTRLLFLRYPVRRGRIRSASYAYTYTRARPIAALFSYILHLYFTRSAPFVSLPANLLLRNHLLRERSWRVESPYITEQPDIPPTIISCRITSLLSLSFIIT